MQVESIMTQDVRSVCSDEPVSAAARLFKRENIGCLPVCSSDGKLEGIITDRDITTRCVASGLDPAHTRLKDIMTNGVYTLSPTDSVDTAAETMRKAGVHRLPVCKKGELCGILSLSDLINRTDCYAQTMETITQLSSCIIHRGK